jgi:DNA-binding CsgD family transcriptional regulator
MFLRLSHEMVNLRLNPLFNLLFFGVLSLGMIGFGLALTGRDRLGENPYQTIRLIMISGFTVLTVLIYAYSLFQLFLHSRKFLDQKDRSNIRLFGLIYLIFAVGTVILLNIAERGILLSLAFITLLLSIHLIPVFFLSMYLDRYFVEPVARYEFEKSLEDFILKFEISKRESEIVELICKGKSNRDISDSLFISLQTVKDHVHRIYLKTGVKNRVQLTNLIRTFR